MRTGPKEKPRELKIIEGVVNKRRIPEGIMEPDAGMPCMPTWLVGYGKTVWERLAPKLNAIGVLRFTDRDLFAAYCQTVAEYKDGVQEGNTTKQMKVLPQLRALAEHFGLTPASRSGIHAGGAGGGAGEVKSGAEKLLGGSG